MLGKHCGIRMQSWRQYKFGKDPTGNRKLLINADGMVLGICVGQLCHVPGYVATGRKVAG